MRVDAHPTHCRAKRFNASFGHVGDINFLPRQRMVRANLASYAAMSKELHRKNPVLSRKASQRVM